MSDIISDEYRQAHNQQRQTLIALRREMVLLQRLERQCEQQRKTVEAARELATRANSVYMEVSHEQHPQPTTEQSSTRKRRAAKRPVNAKSD
jgi:hypothetical protein